MVASYSTTFFVIKKSYSNRIFINIFLIIQYNLSNICSLEVNIVYTFHATLSFNSRLYMLDLGTLSQFVGLHSVHLATKSTMTYALIVVRRWNLMLYSIRDFWSTNNIFQWERSQNNDSVRFKIMSQFLGYDVECEC